MTLNHFLKFLNIIKLLHWAAKNHSEHKILDDLYGDMSDKIDDFVEASIGFHGAFVIEPSIEGLDVSKVVDIKVVVATAYREMRDVMTLNVGENSALASLVDDMDTTMAKAIYLLKMCGKNC